MTDDSVSGRATRAFGWSFLNTASSRLGTLVIGIALARLLGPEEFGIFAVATVALMAILSFNELGVSLAVIRWRDDPATVAPTINTISVASSAVLTAAMILGAPWIATTLGDARAAPVVQVLAISILLNGLVATSAAVLQREFMQKQRTIADQVNTWLGAGLSLFFAYLDWGAMSLALGRLIASLVFAAMLVRWSPIPYRFGWDRAIVGRLLRFGLPLAASSIVVFATGYVDQLVVGSTLGAEALGFYVLAFNLASWPISIFSQPLRSVAPAAFSALKSEPERMSRNFVRVVTVLSCVAIPACLAISAASQPLVEFVYGVAWMPAGDILLWMALLAALKIWFEAAYDYLVVQGKSGVVLMVQACTFVVALPLMLWVVHQGGVVAVVIVQVAVALLVAAPLYLVGLHRAGVPASRILVALAVPSVAGGAVWVVGRELAQSIAPPFLAAASAGAVAIVVIAGLGFWKRDELRLLRSAASRKNAT